MTNNNRPGFSVILRQAQELLGQLSGLLVFGAHRMIDPLSIQHRQEFGRVLHPLIQFERSSVGLPRFRRAKALGADQRRTEGTLQIELLARALGRLGEHLKHLEAFSQVGDCLQIGRALGSALAGQQPVLDRARTVSRLRQVSREELGRRLRPGTRLTVPAGAEVDRSPVDATGDTALPTAPPGAAKRGEARLSVEKQLPVLYEIMDQTRADQVVSRLEAEKCVTVIMAPKVRLLNGLPATITDCTQRPFVVGLRGGKPQIRTVREGVVLRVQPAAGRSFRDDEDRPGGPRVAVISHRLAVAHFGRAEQAVGRSLTIDNLPTIVVGVPLRRMVAPMASRLPLNRDCHWR